MGNKAGGQRVGRIRWALAWGVWGLVATLFGCATTPPPKDDVPPVRTYYTLRLGKEEANLQPLGTYTPIWLDWHYSDGSVVPRLGFKAWDFNGDGRFDLVEVLDESGAVKARAFDFDLDGKIDAVQKRVDP